MNKSFNLVLEQYRRLDFILQQPPLQTWRPDGLTRQDVATTLLMATQAQGQVLTTGVAFEEARAGVGAQERVCREESINVYRCAASIYRKDENFNPAIRRLAEMRMNTVPRLVLRMDKTAEVWSTLPLMPRTESAFHVGGLTRADFVARRNTLQTRATTCLGCETRYEVSWDALRRQASIMEDFMAAALAQGRGTFKPGTEARDLIDTIPTAPGTRRPGVTTVDSATNPAPGMVRLVYSADHATSYSILHKLPTDPEYTVVAANITVGAYDVLNLSAGDHLFRVIGHNSRGDGQPSPVVTVLVAVAQAA